MNFIGVLIFANTLGSTMAQDCKVTYTQTKCLRSNELAPWQRGLMKDGDPCFTYGNHRMCFTKSNDGHMNSCRCGPGCGCGSPPPAGPKCDSSKVPTSFVRKCGPGYGRANTMCVYRGMGRGCGGVCDRQLTNAEKQKILKKHNDLRRKVAKGEESGQPSASNMNELVWDDQLEEVAQRWADQCIFEHDNVRSTLNYPKVGQNIAMGWQPWNGVDNNLEEFVQDWYDEVKHFHTGPDRYGDRGGNTGVVGHYTALVWANTKKVGCGFIKYKQGGSYKRLLVCDYGPAGNVIGESIYKRGRPGADCSSSNDGLCA